MPKTLRQLGQDLQSGRSTATSLVQEKLDLLGKLEPKLQAFTHMDADRALKHAAAIDKLRSAGVDLGPLMGIPVAVKDLFTIDGMPTSAGTRVDVQDLVPAQGGFVQMLFRAGCIVLGKTRTSEFALGGYNPSHVLPWNPCDDKVKRMTGGSSHGSAVAMAAGLAGFTVGSDTGGSVRWPAALCGVVGYKSTTNHWPTDGVFPLSPQLDSVGIFTRSVEDAAWVEAALAGRALGQQQSVSSLKLALPQFHFMENLDDAVSTCFHQAIEMLRNAGASITEIHVPEASEIDDIFRCLVPADLLAFLGRARVQEHEKLIDPVANARLGGAVDLRADEYVRMASRLLHLQQLINERYPQFDAWITPTVPQVPAPIEAFSTVQSIADWNRLATQNTRPGNLFNQCGISMPIQHLGAALPVGLQLCAAPGADATLLRVAMAVESCLGPSTN